MVIKKVIILFFFLIVFPLIVFGENVDYEEIKAEGINYNIKTGAIKTTGQTKVVGIGGKKMTLRDGYITKKSADGKNISMEWTEHTYMTAEKLYKKDDLTYADNVSYTACHNCDSFGDAWTIHAVDMTHDAKGKDMYFYNVWFDVYGMPILYWPYYSQPDPTVKYRSGLLMPDIGSTTNLGTRINIPIYLNFSNYHDMTLTSAYLTDENPLFIAEHRLQLNNARFDTDMSFIHTKENLNRWHFFHDNRIDIGENMRFLTFIQHASDKTYLQTYGFYDAQPFLESNARLEMFADRGYATVDLTAFQELRQKLVTNSIIPRSDILSKVHGTYQIGIADDLYGQFTGDMMRIQDSYNDSSLSRLIGEARVIAPVEIGWQKVTISAAVRGDNYLYENMPTTDDLKDRTLASGYIDWEMPFSRSSDPWTQVIKPKVRLTVMGKSDEEGFINTDSTGALLSDASLFVNNRYSGYDMWVNGTYADYGISLVGYNSNGQSVEFFVGQTYDFDTDADPDINSGYHNGPSDIVGRIGITPLPWLNMTNRFRLDNETTDLRHLESDVRLGKRNYISFGYIWAVQFSEVNEVYVRDKDMSEGTIGAGVYLTNRLSLRTKGIYNFTNTVMQSYNGGIYYDHPCYTLALIYNVDNSVRILNNSELDYLGSKTLTFTFTIKMGA